MKNKWLWCPAVVVLAAVLGAPAAFGAADEISYTSSSRNALSFFRAGIELDDNLYQEEAAAQFRMAIELDPRFASAYLYLARTSGTYTEYKANLDRAVALLDEVGEGEQLLIRAEEARHDNRPADEERLLRRLVALYPGDVNAHYRLAEVYFAQADYDHAIHQLKHCTELDDEFPPAYNLLGYSYASTRNYDAAISILRAYASLIPDEPNPNDSLGEVYLLAGKYDDSIAKYSEALQTDPTFYSAYAGRGHCNVFKGDRETALAEYHKMIEVAPTDVVRRDGLRWIALAELYFGNFDAAKDGLRDVRTASDEAGEILAACNRAIDLAWVEFASEAPERASVVLEDGWQRMMGSDLPEPVKQSYARRHHIVNGICAASAGDMETARTMVERVRRLVEQSEDLDEWEGYNWLVGEIALFQGEDADGIANLLQADPENPRVLFLLGYAHDQRGEHDRAQAYFRQILDFSRPGLLYYLIRSSALKKLG